MKAENNTLSPGTILHSSEFTYRITEFLGQGSFGITYLATTQVKGKAVVSGSLGNIETEGYQTINVAIKEFFMKETNSRSYDGSTVEGTSGELTGKYRKKFRKEAENLSHLNHPNVVKVLEVFDANNTTYYAMQYILGQNLNKYIESKGHLSEQEAIDIIQKVAVPLKYMHDRKMLHLDLKPKNIMIGNDGEVTLIDFGLSKQYDDNGEPESSTTVGLGTPGYAPIEQANYKQDGSFPATLDIYALGATLYKMVVGQTPPEAPYILDGFPAMPAYVPTHLWNVIEQAMQPNRRNRPQSVQIFQTMLGVADNDAKKTKDDFNNDDTYIQNGLPVDSVKRANRSTNSRDSSEQYNLGHSYYYGNGVPKDYVKAVEWFTKAANQGNADAQNMLGICYYYGKGVYYRDYVKAVYWFEKAAYQGHSVAQYNTGLSYEHGMGVPMDIKEAKQWYDKAMKQGHEEARNAFYKIVNREKSVTDINRKFVISVVLCTIVVIIYFLMSVNW